MITVSMFRSWFLNTIVHKKETGLLIEIIDSWAGTGKIQDVFVSFITPERNA
jgi:hypothetical protein